MQDATTEAEGPDTDPPKGDATLADRMDRVEGDVGDIGMALDLASQLALKQSQLALEQNELLRQVATALSAGRPPLP